MTDDRTTNPDPSDPAAMSRAQRIRAAADGEIPLDNISAHDMPRVEFERALRRAVQRTAPNVSAPPQLRARIEHLLSEKSENKIEPVAPAEIPLNGVADTRRPSFWNRSSRWLGVAAVLALCAAVVVSAFRAGGSSASANIIQAASFVRKETDACAEINDRFNTKFKARSRDEALEAAHAFFTRTPEVLLVADDALTSRGYRFAGFGRCAVPGPGKSAHLIYHADSGAGDALSLFIQEQGDAASGFQPEACYLVPCRQPPRERVAVWRENGFVYYLFSHNTEALAVARGVFDAPAREVMVR